MNYKQLSEKWLGRKVRFKGLYGSHRKDDIGVVFAVGTITEFPLAVFVPSHWNQFKLIPRTLSSGENPISEIRNTYKNFILYQDLSVIESSGYTILALPEHLDCLGPVAVHRSV